MRAAVKKGNLSVNQVLVDPKANVVTPQAFASNFVVDEDCGDTADDDLGYIFSLSQTPVRARSVTIEVKDLGLIATDDGLGNLVGIGCSGTVTYSNGAVTLDLTADPGETTEISASYQVNYETADDIPIIDSIFDSTSIMARVFALKGTIGMLQSFAMQKRFGLVAEDELAKDLVNEINAEIGGALILAMKASAVDNTDWDRTPDDGVPYYLHKDFICAN